MTSAPSSSYLSVSAANPRRGHRHRRSGAISGDFDLTGLGLLSPPPPLQSSPGHSTTKLSPQTQSGLELPHRRLYLTLHATGDDFDRHFNFSNEEDFTNKPLREEFAFPKPPDMLNSPQSTPRPSESPRRAFAANLSNLNSPIRLKHKSLASSMAGTPRLFLTDETVFDSHNVPDALIDLDDILNANVTSDKEDASLFDRNDSTPRNLAESFFAFPSSRQAQPPNSSSPFSSPAYLKQPMKEPENDAIKEEDDAEFVLADETLSAERDPRLALKNDLGPSALEAFSSPRNPATEMYSTSAGSSTSSLLPTSLLSQKLPYPLSIEKTLSNSSRDSGASLFGAAATPSTLRSSAKATRYQSFYDQTMKISSSLKYASSESIPLLSGGLDGDFLDADRRALGHSASLSSLKSGIKRNNTPRFGDVRVREPKVQTQTPEKQFSRDWNGRRLQSVVNSPSRTYNGACLEGFKTRAVPVFAHPQESSMPSLNSSLSASKQSPASQVDTSSINALAEFTISCDLELTNNLLPVLLVSPVSTSVEKLNEPTKEKTTDSVPELQSSSDSLTVLEEKSHNKSKKIRGKRLASRVLSAPAEEGPKHTSERKTDRITSWFKRSK